ncbi:DUF349 domain-containing protein, partial [Agrococcus citreus]|uniref:DUF349 domain-containing protein n=1 Tax=Agrococcus citreus TaxID=84643 RepID=UPI0031E44162
MPEPIQPIDPETSEQSTQDAAVGDTSAHEAPEASSDAATEAPVDAASADAAPESPAAEPEAAAAGIEAPEPAADEAALAAAADASTGIPAERSVAELSADEAPIEPAEQPADEPAARPAEQSTEQSTEALAAPAEPAAEEAPAAEGPTFGDPVIERGMGAVDATGTVAVKDGDAWRVVGQFPDVEASEALGYFERKFADLEGQVRLLEQRIRGGANARDVAKAAAHLHTTVSSANAVGDTGSLLTRLDALRGELGQLEAKQQAASKAEVDEAIAERTRVVEAIEQLAAADLENVQWKQTMQRVDALFADWQRLQKDGPRLSKGQADALWKRFRDARATLEGARRRFFADLDASHKDVRARKQALVDQAKALAPKGVDGIPAYRALLDDWKNAGRAGRKIDDALWAQFKEAGDVLFQAKTEQSAVENEEYTANLEAKRALLEEAAPILQLTDRAAAREALLPIQRRWDEIGRVPREALREVEDKMRAIETHVRELDERHWKASNPERKARSEGLAGQLEEAIEKLEAEVAAATDAKQRSELEAELATKRSWLEVVAAAG